MIESDFIEIDFEDALNLFGLHDIKTAVFGAYFVAQLVRFQYDRKINPRSIIDEVRFLEGLQGRTRTKNARKFKNGKMAGFWHKHFFEARHIFFNIAQHHLSGNSGEISKSAERVIYRIFDPKKAKW